MSNYIWVFGSTLVSNMVAVFSYNYLRRIIRILDKKHNADTCSVGAELWTGGFGRGGADNKYKVHTMLFFLNHRYNNTKTSWIPPLFLPVIGFQGFVCVSTGRLVTDHCVVGLGRGVGEDGAGWGTGADPTQAPVPPTDWKEKWICHLLGKTQVSLDLT